MRPCVVLAFLAALSCVEAERLYFLTKVGLSSILTTGDGREDYNQWSGASAHCADDARGLGIDEIEGWASVTCGTEFFKANFAETPNAPFEMIDFGIQVKDSKGFYGTAINTETHTAYVASYESSTTFNGWKVRGNYLRGCTTVTSQEYCEKKGPCYWTNDKCLVKDKYTKMSFATAAGPVGGGLYADEANDIWLSYDVPTGATSEGGGYVKAKTDSGTQSYPHVHDTFPEENYGKQEIGYPQMINDALYVCSQTADATQLFKFDATHDPELIIEDLPQFRGTYIGDQRPIRQPSFAVIDTERVLQVNTAGIDEYNVNTKLFQTVVSERGIGPLFYRLLPKRETVEPGLTATPTAPPPTPQPAIPETSAPAGKTKSPLTVVMPTLTPGETKVPTPPTPGVVPTLVPGETMAPATFSPNGAAVPPTPVQSASSDDNSSGLTTTEVILIVAGAALLCMSFGLLVGFLVCKRPPPPVPLVEEHKPTPLPLYEAKEVPQFRPESPNSNPPESPHWLPISDRNFSDCPTLIQSCELTVVANMRAPAGEVRESFAESMSGASAGRGHSPNPQHRRRSVTHTQHAFSPLTASPHSSLSHHSVPQIPASPSALFTPKERFNSVHDKTHAMKHTHRVQTTLSV